MGEREEILIVKHAMIGKNLLQSQILKPRPINSWQIAELIL
jgi:hypothetical protein